MSDKGLEWIDEIFDALLAPSRPSYPGAVAKKRAAAKQAVASKLAEAERLAIKELKAIVKANEAEEAPICHFGQGYHQEDAECFREYGRADGVKQTLDVLRDRIEALETQAKEK